MAHWAWPIWTPGAWLAVFIKGIIATNKIQKLWASWFQRRRFFYVFSYCKSMGSNDPRGVANLDPKGMIGTIYVGCH